jgi:hypothetical protein
MTEILDKVALEALAEEATRFSGERLDDGTIELPPVEALIWPGSVSTSYGGNTLSIEIFADHEDLPEPIVFVAVGSGDDYRQSARLAAEQWFQVVFPVLHSAFADHETLNVKSGTMQAVNGKGERFDWIVHPGPIRVVAAGPEGTPAPPEDPPTAMLEVLMNDVTGVAASTLPFWVDAYAALTIEGEELADCRLTNFAWEAGTKTIATYAAALELHGYRFMSQRQFILFIPKTSRNLAVAPELTREKKPWWKKLFS